MHPLDPRNKNTPASAWESGSARCDSPQCGYSWLAFWQRGSALFCPACGFAAHTEPDKYQPAKSPLTRQI